MARNEIPTYVTGQLVTAAHGNTYWRDNEAAHWAKILDNFERFMVVPVFGSSVPISIGDGKRYFTMPMDVTLKSADAGTLVVVSTDGDITVALYNVTKAEEVLSTLITVEEGARNSYGSATPSVVLNGDIDEGDLLRVDVDGAGVGAKGLDSFLVVERR